MTRLPEAAPLRIPCRLGGPCTDLQSQLAHAWHRGRQVSGQRGCCQLAGGRSHKVHQLQFVGKQLGIRIDRCPVPADQVEQGRCRSRKSSLKSR